MRKLKVFRTPIGFHDAYVAASSQKAALEAWGSDVDLFSRGVAEVVTDEALTREPLDHPGKVIKRPRGSAADYMAALPKDKPAAKRSTKALETEGRPPTRRSAKRSEPKPSAPRGAPRAKAAPKRKPKPRPSRAKLDAAERAIEKANAEHDAATADLRRREQVLRDERRELDRHHADAIEKLEVSLDKIRAAYSAAIEKWAGDDRQ
ncbi:hypothetical protein DMC47_32125 [Nostoc sp. 3335mG]|nr:hypothetical protein DMC47_32125 [Nostoc sp. 3335mG]